MRQYAKPEPISCGNCGKLTKEQLDPFNPICVRCKPTNCTICKQLFQWSEIVAQGACATCAREHYIEILYKRRIYNDFGQAACLRYMDVVKTCDAYDAFRIVFIENTLPCLNAVNGCRLRAKCDSGNAYCAICTKIRGRLE